ncbi:DUF1778 domain-containing protein [Steroidobacter sp. S1-65]|uniref:DUF1778 domain-containing protein n=1 Tax=Steroidobacter gossypii TaxID=2805490 RepID=A0ABS1WZP6_9GAMM|nr:DUF1778 domain-containing protein [Steroidobacter gossypii]MBM0106446.1 DUF1778 domain-containing protein [Steroidobacter gossypii]
MSRNPDRKDELIHIRASAATKEFLNRAATLRGQKLPEFILESARARADETILDQSLFLLPPGAYERFVAMLDAPDTPKKAVRARMRRKPVWQE